MLQASISGRIGSLLIRASFDTRGGPLLIVGPNGAGKTTLLLMLLGIRRPDSGRIVVADTTLFDSQRRVEIAVEERRLGYVPQDYALFPHLTVLENVEFARASGAVGDRASVRADSQRVLENFGLSALANRQTTNLSGGEKQKVALARRLRPSRAHSFWTSRWRRSTRVRGERFACSSRPIWPGSACPRCSSLTILLTPPHSVTGSRCWSKGASCRLEPGTSCAPVQLPRSSSNSWHEAGK